LMTGSSAAEAAPRFFPKSSEGLFTNLDRVLAKACARVQVMDLPHECKSAIGFAVQFQ
jgi:hypothetical protein